MIITIEGFDYSIPVSLLEVTLQDRINYDNTYGKALQEKLKGILELPDELGKELTLIEYQCEVACKTLSHFGKISLPVVEQTDINDVWTIYASSMQAMSADIDYSEERSPVSEFTWKDAEWEIAPPELKNESKMTFGEFLDAKGWVKGIADFGGGNYEALLGLCCVYFRKKDESYSEELIQEGGERMELMKTLPLEYALEVGFFLTISMASFLKTLPSFGPAT